MHHLKKEGGCFTKNVTKSDKGLGKGGQTLTKNVTKSDKELGKEGKGFTKNVAKSDQGGIGFSQNSDVTHSKSLWLHTFFNALFVSLYLMRL